MAQVHFQAFSPLYSSAPPGQGWESRQEVLLENLTHGQGSPTPVNNAGLGRARGTFVSVRRCWVPGPERPRGNNALAAHRPRPPAAAPPGLGGRAGGGSERPPPSGHAPAPARAGSPQPAFLALRPSSTERPDAPQSDFVICLGSGAGGKGGEKKKKKGSGPAVQRPRNYGQFFFFFLKNHFNKARRPQG